MPGLYSRFSDLVWPAIGSGLLQIVTIVQAVNGASVQVVVATGAAAICNALLALRA